jgi:hypothetical protein
VVQARKMIDPRSGLKLVKLLLKKKLLEDIKIEEIANDTSVDRNHIIIVNFTKYLFGILSMAVQLLGLCIITGFLLAIVFQFSYIHAVNSGDWDIGEDTFIYQYLRDLTLREASIKMVYYSFTTLSTIGLGDLHPHTNLERIFVAIIMMIGVSIYSLMMGHFIHLIEGFNEFNADYE